MRWEKVVWVAMVLFWVVAGCGRKSEPASLHDAVRRGDVEAVKRLIARGADLNAEDTHGCAPLYVVADAGGGNVGVAEVLIAHGADVNRERRGWATTVLYEAARNGQYDLVDLLIRNGADVRVSDPAKRTPLQYAAERGHTEVVKLLLAHGAEVNAVDQQGRTVLHVVAEAGYEDLTELFLAGGVGVDARDDESQTPLHYAAGSGRLGVVRILLARGADIDAASKGGWIEGWTPLCMAARGGEAEVVDFLLSQGARIDAAKYGDRLLCYAASHGMVDLAGRLVTAGVDVNCRYDNLWMPTPLVAALAEGHMDVAKLLVEHGADIHARDRRIATALHVAVRNGDLALVGLLLARGAAVDDKDEDGNTPLHWAARQGRIEIAQQLIAHYADANAQNWAGVAPLHYAVAQDQTEMARLLLANGADANVREKDGDTPLHLAAARGRTEIVELLLKSGAAAHVKDGRGLTPLDEAKQRKHIEIVRLFEAIPAGSGEVAATGEKPQTEAVAAETPGSRDVGLESLRVEKVTLSAAEQARRNLKLLVQGNSAFAFDLYRRLSAKKGNLFFSPYSISTALGMTYAGARENTEAQMAQVLHFSLDQADLHPAFAELQTAMAEIQRAGDVRLHVANALWPQQGKAFLDDYLSLVKTHYGVSIISVDYISDQARAAALKTINTWVEQKTDDKIKDLLQPHHLNDLTRLVLTNAIYFKGDWEHQFDPNDTQDAPFYVTVTQPVETPMMAQTENVRYAELTDLQIVELAYRGGELSMLVLLPKARDGLAQIERDLTADTLERWRQDLNECEVRIHLPKFKMTFTVELKKELMAMGMADAFTWPGANFGGLDGDPNWFVIGEVVHKAYVDVNEEGTEAAAATAVVMMLGGGPPKPPEFRADHPFLFLIQDNRTGSILFLGRVVDPR